MEFKNQLEMFNWIWDTREHKSEISDNPLLPKGHFQWHWQFAHVLPKGVYTKFKLNPDNIMLMLPEEHEEQEQYQKFQDKKIELLAKYREHDKKNI